MKSIMIVALMALALFTSCNQQKGTAIGPVNPIIGNISFVEKFGKQPDSTTDENLRIKTHLEYVEQILRQKDISDMPVDMQKKRAKLLDLLHDYRTAGNFPKNYDHPNQRKPCFIDKEGNICAVGYLVEQTAGPEVAKKINARYQYAEIYDMDLPALTQWVAQSGLTLKECAMIQPAYDYERDYISPQYGFSTAMLGGLNASMNVLNAIDLAKGHKDMTKPIIGIASGTASTTLGLLNYDWKAKKPGRLNDFNGTNQVVSMFNIGFGTATMILSGYTLFKKPKNEQQMTCWNIYSFPAANNQTGIGLSLTRRF